MYEIMNISGIDCYEQDGTAYLKLETVARGLGFTQVAASGNEVVRWERVRKYLSELGVPTCGDDGFIPENIFYRLAMKAKNEAAERFQAKIADEVIPAIRRHGAYMTPEVIERVLLDPDTIIKLATTLKEERERSRSLEQTVSIQRQQIAELQPKASYYDVVLNCKDALAISVIAKDYGWSAKKMNKMLHQIGVQYKQGDIWLLYQKYAEQGYTVTKTQTFNGTSGDIHTRTHTYWTQKGRLFIYDLLKKNGYLPLIEREKIA